MSFRCERCHRALIDGIKPIVIVIERREKIYPVRRLGKTITDKGGRGSETVSEIQVCPLCAKEMR
jgi:hypothetical protein